MKCNRLIYLVFISRKLGACRTLSQLSLFCIDPTNLLQYYFKVLLDELINQHLEGLCHGQNGPVMQHYLEHHLEVEEVEFSISKQDLPCSPTFIFRMCLTWSGTNIQVEDLNLYVHTKYQDSVFHSLMLERRMDFFFPEANTKSFH